MNDTVLYIGLIGAFFLLPLVIVLANMGVFRRQNLMLVPEDQDHPKPKKKLRFSICPWCKSTVELVRNPNKSFKCPICRCEFRHNYPKWVVAIPAVFIFGVLLLRSIKFIPPAFIAMCSVIAVAVATRKMPDYKIIVPGSNPPPDPQESEAFIAHISYQQSRHVSFRNRKQLVQFILIIVLGFIMMLLLARL